MEAQRKIITGATKTVEINGSNITVRKLGLISYTKMQAMIDSLTETASQVMTSYQEMQFSRSIEDTNAVTETIKIISQALLSNVPLLIDFLELCTDIDRKSIEECIGVDDAITLVDAIIEVNRLASIGDSIKNLVRGLIAQ